MTIGEAYMLYLKYSDIGLMPGIPLIDNKTEQDNKDEVFYEYMNILLHLELGLVPDITGSKYYLIAYRVIMNWDENIFTDWQQAEAELRNTEAVEAAKRQRAMQRAVTRADAERETTGSVRPADFVMGSVTSAAAAQAPPPPRGVAGDQVTRHRNGSEEDPEPGSEVLSNHHDGLAPHGPALAGADSDDPWVVLGIHRMPLVIYSLDKALGLCVLAVVVDEEHLTHTQVAGQGIICSRNHKLESSWMPGLPRTFHTVLSTLHVDLDTHSPVIYDRI